MTKLRNINVKQCLNLLKDFHEDVQLEGNESLMRKNKTALLALDQLAKIIGGDDSFDTSGHENCVKDALVC